MPVMSFVWIFVFLVAGNAVTILGKGAAAEKPEMHSEVGGDIFLPHSYYVKLQNEKNHKNETALRAVEIDYLDVEGSVAIADVIPDDRRGIRVSSQGVVKTNGKSIRKHNITILKHEQVQKTYYPLESDEWSPTIRDDLKSAASNNRNTSQANKQERNSDNHKRSATELTRTKRSTWSKLMSPTSRHTPIRSYRKTKRSKSERRPRSNRPGNSKATHKWGASRKLAQNVNFNRRRSTIVANSSKSKTRRPAEGSAFRFRSKNNSSRRRNIKKLNKKRTGAKRSGTKGVRSRLGDIKIRSSRPREQKSTTRANTSHKVVHIKPQTSKLHARRLEDVTPFHEVKKQVGQSSNSEKKTDSFTRRKSVKNANVNFRTDNANSTKETSIRSKRKPGQSRKKNSISSNNSSNAQVKSKDQENKADHRQSDDTKKAKLNSEDTKSVQKEKPPVKKKKNAKESKTHNNTKDDDSEKKKDKALKKNIPFQRKPDEKKSNNVSGKEAPLQNKTSGKILNNTAVDNGSNNKSKKKAPRQEKSNEKKSNTATDNKSNNASNKKDPLPGKRDEKKSNNTAVDNSSNNGSKKKAPLQGKLNRKKLNNTITNNNSNNVSNKKDPLPRKLDEMKLNSTATDNSSNNATKKAASLHRKTDEKKLNKTTIDNGSDNKSMDATKTQNKTKSGDRNPQNVDTDWQDGDRQKLNEDVADNTTADNSLAKNKTTKQKHTKEYSADTLKSNSSKTSDLEAHESNLTTEENIKHKSKPRPGARRSGFVGVYDARNNIIKKKFRDLKRNNNTKPISNRKDIKTQDKQSNNIDSNVLKPKTADRKKGDIENHGSVKLAAKRLGTEDVHGNNVATTKSRSKKINKLDRRTLDKDGMLDIRTTNPNSVRRKGSKTRRKHRPYSNNSLNFRTNSYNSVSKNRTRNKNGRKPGAKSLTRGNAGIKNKRIPKGHLKLSRKSTINFRTANSNSLNSKNIKNRNIRDQRVKIVKKENVKNERTEEKEPKKQVSLNDSDSGNHKSVNLKHSDPKSANETINKYDSSLHTSGTSVEHQQDPFHNKVDNTVKKHRPHSNMVSKRIHAKDNQPLAPKNSGKLILQRLSSRTHQGEGSKKPSQRSQNIKVLNKSLKSRGQDTKTRRRGRAKTISKPKRAKAKKEKNQNEPMFRLFADGIEDEDAKTSERAFPTINKKEERESVSTTQILNNDLKLYREPALYKVEHINKGNVFKPNTLKDNQYSNTINERNHGNDLPCLLQKLNSISGEKSAQNCDESNLPNRQDLNISHEVRLKTSIPFPKTLKKSFMEKVSDIEHGKPTIINFQNGTEYNISNITKTSHSPGGEGQQQVDESIVNTVSKSYSILQIASADPIPKEYLKMILG